MNAAFILIGFMVIALLIYIGISRLQDPQQSLGLPKGSVRAILALIVIITFIAMIVVIVQAAVFPYEAEVLKDVSVARLQALKALPTLVILSEGKLIDGYYAQVTIQQQASPLIHSNLEILIGALVSLVSSLSGYYFGNKRESQYTSNPPEENQGLSNEAAMMMEEVDVLSAEIINATSLSPEKSRRLLYELKQAREALIINDVKTAEGIIDTVQSEQTKISS